jgi:hypothetical protein
VHGAEELPTADVRRESPGFGLPQGAGTDFSSMEAGDGDARAPAPDQPPGESDEFARELASTMSAIASLVIKASGRSVSNGGWLYFNGVSEDYRTFKAKRRLFQETYHKATPPMALVKMFREWNLAEDVACRIEGIEDMPAAWRTLDSIYGAPLTPTTDQTPEVGWMPEPQDIESGMGSEAGPTSEEEPAPLQARGATAFRIVDVEAARPAVEAAISPQGKHVFINTPHGIRSLRRLWVRGEEPEHTVVSKEVAQRYSMRADSRRQATWITGPTGVTVGIDTDYEMFLLVDDLPRRTKRIVAYAVNSVEEYCSLPTGATDEYEIQLGRDHTELLEQLREAQPYRTGARLSERWGETIWRLAAYAESGEHVWINVIRSYQQEESEINLATSRRLGCREPGEGCLVAVHMRAGMCPITEGPIRAWTVEAIGKLEPGDSPDGNGQNPVVEGADMLIGVWDWGRVKEHLWSGWRSTEVLEPRRGGPPLKWHLSTRKTNGEMMHLDVCKGASIARSEITHGAAAVAGLPWNSTYRIQVKGVRAESDFRVQGVDIICNTSARRTRNGELPSWERPDVLLGMEDAKRLEGYLRAGWCKDRETQGGLPTQRPRQDETASVCLRDKPASGNARAAVGGVTKRVGVELHPAARVLRHQAYADDTTLRSQGAARPNQPEAGERRSEKEKWTYVQRIRTGAEGVSTELKVMFDINTPHTLILHTAAARVALAPAGREKWVMSPDSGEMDESSCRYSVSLVGWQGDVHLLRARGVDYTIYAKERRGPPTAAAVFTEMEGRAL